MKKSLRRDLYAIVHYLIADWCDTNDSKLRAGEGLGLTEHIVDGLVAFQKQLDNSLGVKHRVTRHKVPANVVQLSDRAKKRRHNPGKGSDGEPAA